MSRANPVSHDQVMSLVKSEGLTYREAGQRLGISHARVGQIVNAAGLPVGGPARKGLHRSKRRERLYKFICDYKITHDGHSPSYRVILTSGVGYSGKSSVFQALRALERQGLIEVVHLEGGKSYIKIIGGQYVPPQERSQQ